METNSFCIIIQPTQLAFEKPSGHDETSPSRPDTDYIIETADKGNYPSWHSNTLPITKTTVAHSLDPAVKET